MKPKITFSLRTFFVAVAVAAFAFYLTPMTNEATVDFRGSASYPDGLVGRQVDVRIDIQGRNITDSFRTLITNAKLISVEPSDNPKLGRWKIKFRCNLKNRLKLNEYDLLLFRHSER